jgi:hypothetical protein
MSKHGEIRFLLPGSSSSSHDDDDSNGSSSGIAAPRVSPQAAAAASVPKDAVESVSSSSTNHRHPRKELPELPSDAAAQIVLYCDFASASRLLAASSSWLLLGQGRRRHRRPKPACTKPIPCPDNNARMPAPRDDDPIDEDEDEDDGSLAFVWEAMFHRQLFAMAAASGTDAAAALLCSRRHGSSLSSSPSAAGAASTRTGTAGSVPLASASALPIQNEIRSRRRLLSNLIRAPRPAARSSAVPGPQQEPWKSSHGQRSRRHGGPGLPDACFLFVPMGAEGDHPRRTGRSAQPPRIDGGERRNRVRLDEAAGGNVEGNGEEEVQDDEEGEGDHDPPAIPFDCDCFLLLSPTSDEFLLLHPDTGQFVHGAHLGDEARAAMPAAPPRPSNHEGGAAASCRRRHVLVPAASSSTRRNRPATAANLTTNANHQVEDAGGANHALGDGVHEDDDDDDEVVHIGIECKHVAAAATAPRSCHPRIESTVVAVGRQLVHEDPHAPGVDASVITEVRSWERPYKIDPLLHQHAAPCDVSFRPFGSPRICRFQNHFFTMELDAKNRQLLVVPMRQDERDDDAAAWAGRRAVVADAEALPPPNDDELHASGSRFIHVLPFVAFDEGSVSDSDHAAIGSARLFSHPVAKIDCGGGITSLSSSGDVWAVSTVSNKLLWYDRGLLVHAYKIVDCVREALTGGGAEGNVQQQSSLQAPPKRSKEREQLILQSLSKATAVETIRFAPFVGPERAGFVTLSHGDSTGSTILLWKKCSRSGSSSDQSPHSDLYKVDAVVRLPLRASRIPKVHFDGRRLIVYGEDHMGHILLVYVVQSLDDIDDVNDDSSTTSSGGGAGVIVSGSLRFARRVRHDAMGGLSEFDSLHVSANERFIVVNTKTGHQLAGRNRRSSPADGLLVIDVAKAE